MKALLAKTAHTDQDWRIHELAPDFDVYDVWALPTPGGRDDFSILKQMFLSADLSKNPSPVFRALFALRWQLGKWLGWDRPKTSVGSRVPSLRNRLWEGVTEHESPDPSNMPFTSLYDTNTEWAAEMANQTCHAVMHIGWVADPAHAGHYRGQMAVLVKPNGWAGRVYMAAIAPFRFLLVYPPLMRTIAAGWLNNTAPIVTATHAWSEPLEKEVASSDAGGAHYADTLTLCTGSTLSARWWVHTMFEVLISPAGREVLFRGVLALCPVRSPSALIDWRVVEESDQLLRLERSGPLMSCKLTATSDSSVVRLGLVVEPRNPLGVALWKRIAPTHRKMGSDLLRRAWQRSEQLANETRPRRHNTSET